VRITALRGGWRTDAPAHGNLLNKPRAFEQFHAVEKVPAHISIGSYAAIELPWSCACRVKPPHSISAHCGRIRFETSSGAETRQQDCPEPGRPPAKSIAPTVKHETMPCGPPLIDCVLPESLGWSNRQASEANFALSDSSTPSTRPSSFETGP
jgi:hypothetical protein